MTERTIRNVAKDLAGADYEQGTHSERFRKFWPDVKQFIARNWPTYVPMARTIMVDMLRRSDSEIPPAQKEAVYEALMEDRMDSITKGGDRPGKGAPLLLNPAHPGRLEKKIFHDT